MKETLQLDHWLIELVFTDREVNFMIFDQGEYFCRLVPGFTGFELSPLDLALDNDPGERLVARFGSYIHSYFL